MTSSRQRAAVVVLAVTLPLVAVVVAVLARDDAQAPAPLPVLVADEAGGATAQAESSADLVLGGVSYEAGPDLPLLDGTAPAYRLDPVGDADVRRLAAAVGLEDELESDGAGGWTAVDGEQTLSVYPEGLAWSYFVPQAVSPVAIGAGGVTDVGVAGSAGAAEPGCAGPDCTVSSEPVTTIPTPYTTIPPPPADLPSRDEAEAIARDVLAEMGLSVEGAAVQAFDNGYAWSFTFDAVVDGVATLGFSQSLSIGGGGEVLDGYGTLGTPVPVDEYPLTGTADAIERLNRGEAFGWSVAAMGGVASAESGDVDDADDATPLTNACPDVDPQASGCAGDAVDPTPTVGIEGTTTAVTDPAPTVTIEPVPLPEPSPDPSTKPEPSPRPEPLPDPATTVVDPEPILITLTDAEVVLTFMPAADGHGGYLVPAYRFESADGSVAVALAVGDKFLATPDDTGTPDEPAPGTPATDPGTGVTVPDTVPTEPAIDPAPPSSDLETRPTVGPL